MGDTFAGILLVFLRLGLTSFGGPIAHLGYLRAEFVARRGWLSESQFAELLALTQFLPGPASSQLGFSVGLLRGGLPGGIAAWLGFTLPSAVALVGFALGASALTGPTGAGLVHGLQVVAVAVVAQAVWRMSRTLCPDRERASIAVAAAALVAVAHASSVQVLAIAMGAVAGAWLARGEPALLPSRAPFPVSRRLAAASLAVFFALLVGAPLASAWSGSRAAAMFDVFYRAGALVFGGGHVVLPLLESAVVRPGWLTTDVFLAGYGAAQAVPGPLFTFAAFLGASMPLPPTGLGGAALALVAVFLPGLLLVAGVLPFWNQLLGHAGLQAAVRGANAAVVGILLAALYDPVWTGAVRTAADFALALVAFVLLNAWLVPPWAVVLVAAGAGALMA